MSKEMIKKMLEIFSKNILEQVEKKEATTASLNGDNPEQEKLDAFRPLPEITMAGIKFFDAVNKWTTAEVDVALNKTNAKRYAIEAGYDLKEPAEVDVLPAK